MNEQIKSMQRMLRDAGYPVGQIDGVTGPKTATAFKEFLAGELNLDFTVRAEPGELVLRGPVSRAAPADHELPWMAHALSVLGLHETRDNRDLQAFLRSDGSTLGDPAEFPWCGDYVHTALRLGLPDEKFPGRVGENPYLARNWLQFGEECGPSVGAVAVFWRGSRAGAYGHVAFYMGEDDQFVYVLGGNQSNAVTVAKLHKDRLLGYRWPLTSPFKPSGKRVVTGMEAALSVNEA